MDLNYKEVEHEFNTLYASDTGKSLKEKRYYKFTEKNIVAINSSHFRIKDGEDIVITQTKWIRISILLQVLCVKDEIFNWKQFLPCLFKVLHQ